MSITEIRKAKLPQELFGPIGDEAHLRDKRRSRIAQIFRQLAALVHPDKYKGADANALFDKLQNLRDAALHTINGRPSIVMDGNGCMVKPIGFRTRRGDYSLTRRLAVGGTCVIYHGVYTNKTSAKIVVARVARSSKDNDLMDREAKAFGIFAERLKKLPPEDATILALRFPLFIETARIKEGQSAAQRAVNTFEQRPQLETGWFNIQQIRGQYETGLDLRLAAFIWNRMLEGMIFAHECGVTHGAITPNHVLIHAKSHVGHLIDWTNAGVDAEKKLHFIDKEFLAYYPPEMIQNKRSTAKGDVFMAAWCLVYLLGGNPETKTLEASIPRPLRTLITRCLQPNPSARPMAQMVHQEFRRILDAQFGAPKFVELKLAEISA